MMLGRTTYQRQNSEKYRDVSRFSSKTLKFCPKSANFWRGQEIIRAFREFACKPSGTDYLAMNSAGFNKI